MMKNTKHYLNNRAKQSGFTLIEFLVAGALSLIVITAASGTYFITRQLNANTQRRLNVQQNLRNAASLITRDARNAGSFGCFTTASSGASDADENDLPQVDDAANRQLSFNKIVTGRREKNADGYGIRLIDQNQAKVANFPLNGVQFKDKAIVFIYGKGSASLVDGSVVANASGKYTLGTLKVNDYKNDPDISQTVANKGDVVVSSCNDAYATKVTSGTDDSITVKSVNADDLTDASTSQGELSITKLYASAYVVGTINGVSSLLRYDLNAAGQWQGPQLLASNVTSITPTFGYVQNCKNSSNTAAQHNTETFKFLDNLGTANTEGTLPAIVRLHVKYRYDNSNDVDYIINAGVRSGNACSTTLPE